MNDCKTLNETENVLVDVTKIVKYVCIAGVLIVSVIFVTKCITKLLVSNK
ncbi:MAG: hypothetical protein K0S61_3912 [Anaerocolumna sp.]|jgi:hypothetical protein|nr:hypothetical protein [Anaerocolumna sp.]